MYIAARLSACISRRRADVTGSVEPHDPSKGVHPSTARAVSARSSYSELVQAQPRVKRIGAEIIDTVHARHP
jgi:hypothetical protein